MGKKLTLRTSAVLPALFLFACGVIEVPFEPGEVDGAGGSRPDEELRDHTPYVDRSKGDDPIAILRTTEISDPEEPPDGERVACEDRLIRDRYQPTEDILSEVDALLEQMDLDQKLLQITGLPAPPASDLGRYEEASLSRHDEVLGLRGHKWTDGPHGVNLKLQYRHLTYSNYATSFPTSVLQGATFDVELVQRIGEAIGDEAQASGASVLLAPTMNILRHPFWGRAQETFGEDSFHIGRMATHLVLGIQEHIASCAKHYAANNIEADRTKLNAEMDEQTLRETYGRHFEMVVRDAGVACVMAAHNSVNGTKSTQNQFLLSEMLRKDMGFRGFTVADWWAMPTKENFGQGPVNAPEDEITARASLLAGLDIEMPWLLHYDAIPRLIEKGELSEAVVDDAVKNVLEQKLRFRSAYLDEPHGLKEPTTEYNEEEGSLRSTEAHLDLALEAAEKGIVLLKNEPFEGDRPLLPIRDVKKIAVLGKKVKFNVGAGRGPVAVDFDFARDAALGDRGSSEVTVDPDKTMGPYDGIIATKPQGVEVVSGGTVAPALDADLIVVVVGLSAGEEGEEFTHAADRESLDLDAGHTQLVEEAVQLGKPVVVVVEGGSAVNMPWLDDVSAVLMAFHPGQRGGEALGRLLFGQANFSGKLPITWPKSEAQLPEFKGTEETTVMDYFLGYKRFDHEGLEPLFPYGYGLSYSTFEYKNLSVPCETASTSAVIPVTVDVKNKKGPAGDEVVFVFASYPETKARRPKKELKGFARVHLEPGATKRVTIPVRVEDLKYWDMEQGRWVVEEGPVEFLVGPSAGELKLKQTVQIGAGD